MKPRKKILIAVSLAICICLLGIFFDRILFNESRDYALNKEMLQLAHKLRVYKQDHGTYPTSITAVQNSDNLCVWTIYPKCTKVYYQTYNNAQEFHLAMKSFSWVYLWYDDKFCVDPDRDNYLPKLSTPAYWVFCAATPPGVVYDVFPQYRNDKKVFANPSTWPEIK